MRKIIFQQWLSLDGFAADENDSTSFFDQHVELNRYSDDDQMITMENIDTILLGRKTYELFVDFWPATTKAQEIIADFINTTHKIVFSSTMKTAQWGQWPEAQLLSGDAVQHIRTLKSAPGKDMVLWGSISLARLLMAAGLIDEYHFRVCPLTLGKGKRMFGHGKMELELFEFKAYPSGLILLQYRNK